MRERGVVLNKSDLAAGLVLMGMGIFVIWQARRLDLVFEYGPGPGFLPFWLGVGLTSLAAVLVAMALRAAQGNRKTGDRSERQVTRALLTWGGFIGAIALLQWLGFAVSFAVFTFFLVFDVMRSFTALRHSELISRSRLRTPASRV